MSEEQLKAFIAKAKDDQSIQEKLKAAKTSEEVVAIAKEYGHEFTVDVLKNTKVNLSEEELEGVSGGKDANPASNKVADGILKMFVIGCGL